MVVSSWRPHFRQLLESRSSMEREKTEPGLMDELPIVEIESCSARYEAGHVG